MRIDFWKKWLEPKPYNQGYLPADGGHEVFFQEFGNPSGKPILVFHGGPGGSFKAKHVSFADLKKHRVVGFDQRGCGQSKPLGDMRNNNTQELLKDASRLLDYLHIEDKVVVRGGSWGSTLALLFAEAYPQKVEKLLLSQVFLADQTAAEWEFSGLKAFYPEFVDELKQKAGSRGIRTFFAEEINSGDLRRQLEAVNLYGTYERVCGALQPVWGRNEALNEAELASNRIYMNYAVQNFMLKDLQIVKNIDSISGIPVIIVHNRLDFVCPVYGAYMIHKLVPNSKLVIVPDRGHVSGLLYRVMDKVFAEELKN